jgi:hypothetical protein
MQWHAVIEDSSPTIRMTGRRMVDWIIYVESAVE